MKKFRIWDIEKKKFLNDDNSRYVIDNEGKLYDTNPKWNCETDMDDYRLELLEKDKYIVINYVDRKDKKGNPAYEGYIIAWENNGKKFFSVIRYDDFYKCYCINRIGKNLFQYRPLYFLEVGFEIIGNIYENPELIDMCNLD